MGPKYIGDIYGRQFTAHASQSLLSSLQELTSEGIIFQGSIAPYNQSCLMWTVETLQTSYPLHDLNI